MLGFPIRTPPDHSLVANSPGLIAGSNVLHRLLMPRHPPCALHSLSQQRQNHTPSKQHHKRNTSPPPNQRDRPEQTITTQPTRPGKTETGRLHQSSQPHDTTPQTKGSRLASVAKMLASTMQISNNNPTNTQHHPQAAPDKGEHQKQSPTHPSQGRPPHPPQGARYG